MWDELQNYTQLPVTGISLIIIKETEEEQVHQFLMGLNNAMYSTTRSNIIQDESMPKVKNVFAQIRKEE